MKKNINTAFTLVELIVVITILAVLATVAFISFQGYTSSSRDSVRLTDLKNIELGLGIYNTKNNKYPNPDDYIEITAGGTKITYQGYAGNKVLTSIGVNGGGKDPVDNTYYTYSIDGMKNSYQLLGYLESNSLSSYINTSNVLAKDYSSRYPILIGSYIGILLDTENIQPLQNNKQNIDLLNDTGNYTFYESTESHFIGDSNTIFSAMYNLNNTINKNKEFASYDKSLVLYLDMETTTMSGGSILMKDLSLMENNGICYNSGSLGNCGIIGPEFINIEEGVGMNFDGIDDYIKIPYNESHIFNEMTLIAKYKHSGVLESNNGSAWRIISSQGNNNIFFLRVNDSIGNTLDEDYVESINGSTKTHFRDGINSDILEDLNINSLNGNYNTIASTKSDIVKIYSNGNVIDTINSSVGIIDTKVDLYIGALSNGFENFSGIIDEVRIYNRILSDIEIKKISS